MALTNPHEKPLNHGNGVCHAHLLSSAPHVRLSRIQLLTSKISHICQEIHDIKSAKKLKSNSLPQTYTNTHLDEGWKDQMSIWEPNSSSFDMECQEIGLVALMFFFELLFSYVSLAISFYVFPTNLFSLIHSLICRLPETLKMKEKQDSILLVQEQSKNHFTT